MKNIILHSTSLKDFAEIIGGIVRSELQQFKPVENKPAKGGYITRAEVCDFLKISLSTLHYYTKDGTLKGYRIGGRILYRLSEVEGSVQEIQSIKYKHK